MHSLVGMIFQKARLKPDLLDVSRDSIFKVWRHIWEAHNNKVYWKYEEEKDHPH